jgi:hypothetical protein
MRQLCCATAALLALLCIIATPCLARRSIGGVRVKQAGGLGDAPASPEFNLLFHGGKVMTPSCVSIYLLFLSNTSDPASNYWMTPKGSRLRRDVSHFFNHVGTSSWFRPMTKLFDAHYEPIKPCTQVRGWASPGRARLLVLP